VCFSTNSEPSTRLGHCLGLLGLVLGRGQGALAQGGHAGLWEQVGSARGWHVVLTAGSGATGARGRAPLLGIRSTTMGMVPKKVAQARGGSGQQEAALPGGNGREVREEASWQNKQSCDAPIVTQHELLEQRIQLSCLSLLSAGPPPRPLSALARRAAPNGAPSLAGHF